MTLTDKGRALIAKVYPENEAMLDAIFGKWNHEERKAVLRLLSLLELD
jgi:DNA-binding MarR family transcriptional regulator